MKSIQVMKATVVLLFLFGKFLFMSGGIGAPVADDAMPVDLNLIDAQNIFTVLGPEIHFLQTSNDYPAVFSRKTLRCPPEFCGSTKCRCGVLSFPEAGLLKETLLKPAATNTGAKIQVNITDSNVIAGIENLKTVLNLRTATNPKIVGAALTIDPALNVFVGTQGMLNTIPFYRSIIIVCYGLIESLFKLIKGYQPAILA